MIGVLVTVGVGAGSVVALGGGGVGASAVLALGGRGVGVVGEAVAAGVTAPV